MQQSITKALELNDYLSKKKIDLYCVQETKLRHEDRLFDFPNYSFLLRDRDTNKGNDTARGGCVIGVHHSISFNERNLTLKIGRTDPIQHATIEINIS